MSDRALEAVLGLEDGAVEPLLAEVGEVGEVGGAGPTRDSRREPPGKPPGTRTSRTRPDSSCSLDTGSRWLLSSATLTSFKFKFNISKEISKTF